MFTANVASTSGPPHHLRPPHEHHHRHGHHTPNSSRNNLHSNDNSHYNDGSDDSEKNRSIFAQGGMFNTYEDSADEAGSTPSHDERVRQGSHCSSVRSSHLNGDFVEKSHSDENSHFRPDMKTLAYLLCVALIVIGGVVLIILAGMGYLR